MSEPRTEAGRALLGDCMAFLNGTLVLIASSAPSRAAEAMDMAGQGREKFTEAILARAEAIAQERARLREAVEGLGPNPYGSYSDAIYRVLALIDGAS